VLKKLKSLYDTAKTARRPQKIQKGKGMAGKLGVGVQLKSGPRAVDAILLERRGKSETKSVLCFLKVSSKLVFSLTEMVIPRSNLPTTKVAPKAKADPKSKAHPAPPKRRADAKAEPKSTAKKAKKGK